MEGADLRQLTLPYFTWGHFPGLALDGEAETQELSKLNRISCCESCTEIGYSLISLTFFLRTKVRSVALHLTFLFPIYIIMGVIGSYAFV